MDYFNTLVQNNAPIHKAVRLIQQLPVTHHMAGLYKSSTSNELMFLGAAAFVTLYNLRAYIKAKKEKLNLPPHVPFSLPFFGHSLYVYCIPSKFLDWCNEKYGEVYSLDLLGKTITVTSGISAQEAMQADRSDLSMEHGLMKDILHLDYVFDHTSLEIGVKVNPSVARVTIPSSEMPNYVSGIQMGLDNACKDLLNKDKPTILNKPSLFFQNFVAYMTVPTLVGDEFATNAEMIDSFAKFTGDITNNIPLYTVVPQFLHPYMLPYLQSHKKHHAIMEKHVVPVIRYRREKMKRAEEAGIDHGLENNFLQGLIEYVKIDESGNKSQYEEIHIAHSVLMVAFASVHTTSMNLSFSLYWLIARPDLMKRLMEEIDNILPGNTPITTKDLGQMKFLNSFIREVIRQGADTLAIGKRAMTEFTFTNGYQVPIGRYVECNNRQLNFGNNVERVGIDEMDPDASHNKKAPVTPARDFVSFGMGKHLCPGRFFAVQEIMMSLIYILKHYQINTVSGKRPTPVQRFAGTISINSEEPLIFTPRK